jgi:PAS domain S-box-containing protein
METILQHVLVGIVYLKKRIIVSHNRGMEEIFGYEQGELLGKTTEMLYATHETFVEIGHRAYSDLPSVNRYSEEVKLKRKDGCVFWGLLTGRALDPTRAQEGSIWIYTDITDRKNVEEALAGNQERLRTTVEQLESSNAELKQSQGQLLQSEKMAAVGQLAAGVAHEINNPIGFVNSNLGTLKGYVEQLLALIDTYERCAVANGIEADATLQAARERADIAFLRDDVVALLGESRDGLERVKKIVQGLRDFSRIDSSDWQEADLIAGLESTLNVVSNELKYKADVVKNYGELPPVRCHLGQINQVFMNLLVNAAQAIEDRGKITLSSGAQGPWAWVSIEDTGKGMTPEVMKRIFEPFFTTKPVGKGTGLGLSLSYDMVKKHGGHIDVSSQPGLGTCIKVWLPVAGPENPLP